MKNYIIDVIRYFYKKESIYTNRPKYNLLTYLLTYLLSYLLTYLLHGAESFLRS